KVLACLIFTPDYRNFLRTQLGEIEEDSEVWTKDTIIAAFEGLDKYFDLDSLAEHLLKLRAKHGKNFTKLELVSSRLHTYLSSRQRKYFAKDHENLLTFEPHRKFRI